MRKVIDLNFDWKYSETFTEEMIKPGFDDGDFDQEKRQYQKCVKLTF